MLFQSCLQVKAAGAFWAKRLHGILQLRHFAAGGTVRAIVSWVMSSCVYVR